MHHLRAVGEQKRRPPDGCLPSRLRLVVDNSRRATAMTMQAMPTLLPSLPQLGRPGLLRAARPAVPVLWPLVWIAAALVAAASSVVQLIVSRT